MADIFISYSKQDQAEARNLSVFLEAQGYSVWWDRALVSGDKFRKVIMTELAAARIVIVIWTANSVSSDWVQSEAGRAHAAGKLIPVKDALVAYEDIPPPFDNMHTECLDRFEHIESAIVSQLAKPPQAPPIWKVARHQVFSWCGIVGAAITLFTNLSSFLKLTDWARWLATNWIEIAERFWSFILNWIGVELPLILVHDLNIMVFVVMSAIGSKLAFSTQSRDASTPLLDIRMLLRWNVILAGPAYVASRMLISSVMFEQFWPDTSEEPTIDFYYFYWITNILPVLIFIFVLVLHWPLTSNLQTVASMGVIVSIYLFGLIYRSDSATSSESVFLIENLMVAVGGIVGTMIASPSHYPRRLWTIIVLLVLLAVGNEISKLDMGSFAPIH